MKQEHFVWDGSATVATLAVQGTKKLPPGRWRLNYFGCAYTANAAARVVLSFVRKLPSTVGAIIGVTPLINPGAAPARFTFAPAGGISVDSDTAGTTLGSFVQEIVANGQVGVPDITVDGESMLNVAVDGGTAGDALVWESDWVKVEE